MEHGVARGVRRDSALGPGLQRVSERERARLERRRAAKRGGRDADGEWRFTHAPTGSFDGFTFSARSSCASAREFAAYHRFFWLDDTSNYRTAGVTLQRMSEARGVLTMRNATLRRVPSRRRGGKSGEVIAVARDRAEWERLVLEHFFVPLSEVFGVAEREALWEVAESKQREWVDSQTRRRARPR